MPEDIKNLQTMSVHWLAIPLLCLLAANCVYANETDDDDDDGSGMKRTLSMSTFKSLYCDCFNFPSDFRKTCFRDAFKNHAVKAVIRRHRANRQACFNLDKDGDTDCRVSLRIYFSCSANSKLPLSIYQLMQTSTS